MRQLLMDMMTNMTSIKKRIKELQKQRIEEIKNSNISKLEKLELLQDENLYDVDSYIQNEFTELEEHYKKLYYKQWYIFDTLLYKHEYYDKHQTLYYYYLLKDLYENYFEDNNIEI